MKGNTMNIKELPTVNLKVKAYTEVKDRVMFFRADEQYMDWRLVTEALVINAQEATFKASVFDAGDRLMSTGYATEVAGAGMVNKTNHVENCETSAVGRALFFLGIGIVCGIATADNMKVVAEEQISEDQFQEIMTLIQDTNTDLVKFNEQFSITKLVELGTGQYGKAIALLRSKKAKMTKEQADG